MIDLSPRSRVITVVAAIGISLAFVASDSALRYRRILTCQNSTMGAAPPKIDPSSPTGYELGMRVLVLPEVGIDGCHWIMHTQKMLAQGGWRIRYTDNDNVPDGREIHWSHGFIWWLVILGKVHSTITGLPLAASVEAVAPYANTLIFALLIATLPWLTFRHFGPVAAAGLAIGLGSIYTFYEYFIVGNADHHGIAASGALVCAMLLAVGGAGWISDRGEAAVAPRPLPSNKGRGERSDRARASKYEYEVDSSAARRYFAGSAIAGSIALWVSAATAVPTFFGIGLGALISSFLFGRSRTPLEPQYHPELWRRWGRVGCCGSLFFYLLEYFPFHMGWRLEVNHPLYALAWLGGGELLYRITRWRVKGISPWGDRWGLASFFGAFVAVSLLPALVKLFPDRFFWISDTFLWNFHKDYIHEFKTIVTWASERATVQSFINVCLFPVMGIVVFRLLFLRELGRSWRGVLTLIILPSLLVTALGLLQVRWLGIANALLLPSIPTCLGCLFGKGFPHRFHPLEKIVGVVIACILFVVFPQSSIRLTLNSLGRQPDLSPSDAFGIFIRDISHSMRRADPEREFVVLSGPTTTTHMMYFGGMKGIGTLYWENLPGLKNAARLYAARSGSEAIEMLQRHHVSHIAVYASDAFAYEYTRLLRGLPFGAEPKDAFVPSMINNLQAPFWVKPSYIQPPEQFPDEWVIMMDIRPNQTEAEANFAFGEFHEAKNEIAGALNNYQRALDLDPNNREAALRLGRLLLINGGGDEAKPIFEKGLVDRSPAEVTNICGQLALRAFNVHRHVEAVYLLRLALAATPGDAGAINALAWVLATSIDPKVNNPGEAVELAKSNTSVPNRVTYLDTLAAAQAASGNFADAIASMKEAIALLPTLPPSPSNPTIEQLVAHLQTFEAGKPVLTGVKP